MRLERDLGGDPTTCAAGGGGLYWLIRLATTPRDRLGRRRRPRRRDGRRGRKKTLRQTFGLGKRFFLVFSFPEPFISIHIYLYFNVPTGLNWNDRGEEIRSRDVRYNKLRDWYVHIYIYIYRTNVIAALGGFLRPSAVWQRAGAWTRDIEINNFLRWGKLSLFPSMYINI